MSKYTADEASADGGSSDESRGDCDTFSDFEFIDDRSESSLSREGSPVPPKRRSCRHRPVAATNGKRRRRVAAWDDSDDEDDDEHDPTPPSTPQPPRVKRRLLIESDEEDTPPAPPAQETPPAPKQTPPKKKGPGRPKGTVDPTSKTQRTKAAAKAKVGRPPVWFTPSDFASSSSCRYAAIELRNRPDPDADGNARWAGDIGEFSITISVKGGEIHPEALLRMEAWVRHRCVQACISLERGDHEGHLHIQATARLRVDGKTDAGMSQSLNKELARVVGWNGEERPHGGVIQVKTLCQTDLHTFEGMCGYVTKNEGKDEYKNFVYNVTPEELARGKELYLLHGAGAHRFLLALPLSFAKAAEDILYPQ